MNKTVKITIIVTLDTDREMSDEELLKEIDKDMPYGLHDTKNIKVGSSEWQKAEIIS